jgi:hypothetical protein
MTHSIRSSGNRVNNLKGRVAEALVENILHRAGYKIARVGRESQVQHMLKTGISEFLPDFLVWRPIDAAITDGPLHQVLSVEVKYRHKVSAYLARFGGAFPLRRGGAVAGSPRRPRHRRSRAGEVMLPGPQSPRVRAELALVTRDLYEVPELGIYRSTVEEYEQLAKQIFSLLAAQLPDRWRERKPLRKVTGYEGHGHDAGAGSP